MPALEAGQCERGAPGVGRGWRGLGGERQVRVAAAGAADVDDPLFLGVEVEQAASHKQRPVQPGGAGQAGFFVDREETLERAVDEIGCLHDGEHRGDADAVVRAERRASCGDVVARPLGDYRVGREVERDVAVLLLHHVEVRLQDRHVRALVPSSARFPDDDITGGVDRVGQTEARGDRDHMLPHPLLVLRGARDGEDGVELRPDGGRFQARNEGHGSVFSR